MDKLFGAKVSIHRLGNSIWSMKDVVCNESGKTSLSSNYGLSIINLDESQYRIY